MTNYSTVDGYNFDAQINYGWGLTLNMTGKAPEVSKRIFDTYEHMLYYVNDYNDSCVPGLVLKVMGDTDALKNGVYFVAKIGTNKPEVNENGEVVLDDKGQPVLSNTFANDGEVIKLASEGKVSGDVSVLQEALEAEIAARKAVDGQTGQTYAANSNTTYISGASSLNDADAKLDVAISNEVSAREQAIEDLQDAIDAVRDAAISVAAGDGISVTGEGTEKTIAAVTKEGETLIEVTKNGIGIKADGYIDCGTF